MNLNNAICLQIFPLATYQSRNQNIEFHWKSVDWKSLFYRKDNLELFFFYQKIIWKPFVYEIFTSQLSSSWMSILKICTFAPLNAGGSISASYWIFMPYNSTAWIDGMTFVRGNERFAHPVRDLERNSNHTILKYMWQDEGKIGNRKPFQSCASFAYWCLIQKIWIR